MLQFSGCHILLILFHLSKNLCQSCFIDLFHFTTV